MGRHALCLAIDIEYLDVESSAEKSFEHAVPKKNTMFSYVVEGSFEIAGKQVTEGRCAVLGEGNKVVITSAGGSLSLCFWDAFG